MKTIKTKLGNLYYKQAKHANSYENEYSLYDSEKKYITHFTHNHTKNLLERLEKIEDIAYILAEEPIVWGALDNIYETITETYENEEIEYDADRLKIDIRDTANKLGDVYFILCWTDVF